MEKDVIFPARVIMRNVGEMSKDLTELNDICSFILSTVISLKKRLD